MTRTRYAVATSLVKVPVTGIYSFYLTGDSSHVAMYLDGMKHPLFERDVTLPTFHEVTLKLSEGYHRLEVVSLVTPKSHFAVYFSDRMEHHEPSLLAGDSLFLPLSLPSYDIPQMENLPVIRGSVTNLAIQSTFMNDLSFTSSSDCLKVVGHSITAVVKDDSCNSTLSIISAAGESAYSVHLNSHPGLEGHALATYVSSITNQLIFEQILPLNVTPYSVIEAHTIHYTFHIRVSEVGEYDLQSVCGVRSITITDITLAIPVEMECPMNTPLSLSLHPQMEFVILANRPPFSYRTSVTSFIVNTPIESISLLDTSVIPENSEVTVKPTLPSGLSINRDCTISGTPMDNTPFTEYSVSLVVDDRIVASTTISFDIHGYSFHLFLCVDPDPVVDEVIIRYNGKEVPSLSVLPGSLFLLEVVVPNTNHYHVDFVEYPTYMEKDGYRLSGVFTHPWGNELQFKVVSMKGDKSISIPVEYGSSTYMTTMGHGTAVVYSNRTLILSTLFTDGGLYDLNVAHDSYDVKVICKSLSGCWCLLYPSAKWFYSPFKEVVTHSIDVTPSMIEVVDFPSVVTCIAGSSCPSPIFHVKGVYQDIEVDSLPSYLHLDKRGFTFTGIATVPREDEFVVRIIGRNTLELPIRYVVKENEEQKDLFPVEFVMSMSDEMISFELVSNTIVIKTVPSPTVIQMKDTIQVLEIPSGVYTINNPSGFDFSVRLHGIVLVKSQGKHTVEFAVNSVIPAGSLWHLEDGSEYISGSYLPLSGIPNRRVINHFKADPSIHAYGMYLDSTDVVTVKINDSVVYTTDPYGMSYRQHISFMFSSAVLVSGDNTLVLEFPSVSHQSHSLVQCSLFVVSARETPLPMSLHSSLTSSSDSVDEAFGLTTAYYKSDSVSHGIFIQYPYPLFVSDLVISFKYNPPSRIMVEGVDNYGVRSVIRFIDSKQIYNDSESIHMYLDTTVVVQSINLYFFNIDIDSLVDDSFYIQSIQFLSGRLSVCKTDGRSLFPYEGREQSCSNPKEYGKVYSVCEVIDSEPVLVSYNYCYQPYGTTVVWSGEITGFPALYRYQRMDIVVSAIDKKLENYGYLSNSTHVVGINSCHANSSPYKNCIRVNFISQMIGFALDYELILNNVKDSFCMHMIEKDQEFCSSFYLDSEITVESNRNWIGFVIMIVVLIVTIVAFWSPYRKRMQAINKEYKEKQNRKREMNMRFLKEIYAMNGVSSTVLRVNPDRA